MTPPKIGSGELDAAAKRKFDLWFFRDMSDEQRLALFRLFGMPVDEISKVHGHQRRALKHILRALAAPVDHPEVVVVKALIERLWPNGFGPNNLTEVAIFIEEERKCDAEYRSALQPSDSPALEAGVAEARVAKLEEVLDDLLSWFDKPSEPEWRIKAGPYGADDAVEAARAALATPAKEPGK